MADFPKAPPPLDDGTPDPVALGFEPFQKMVKWFTPSELTRTGAEAVISSLFGAYADNREIQALRGETVRFDYATEPPAVYDGAARKPLGTAAAEPVEDLWVDYVADLGDGWDPTYAIASLLAAETLTVGGHETRRGRVLVLGGDQVYPTAKKDEYQNRFAGPYRAALPYVRDTPPHLFAVPGNHDWYDGLTSFTRLLCQGRWIGGWKTQQSRSYFALQLPGNWWLWGLDVQLASDIDEPQLNYFRRLGAQLKAEHPEGVDIILCLAEPVWATAGATADVDAYDTLAQFEDFTMTRYGHRHRVGLAGDLHAYGRWESEDGRRQRFISGGGGAYLYPSHLFPPTLRLPTGPKGPGQTTETFRLGTAAPGGAPPRKAIYPPERASWNLAGQVILFPALNTQFSLFFGMLYLVLAWLVQSASKALGTGEASFFQQLADAGQAGGSLGDAFRTGARALVDVLAHAPLAALLAAILFAGLTAFADGGSHVLKRLFGDRWGVRVGKGILGTVHTLLHLGAFVLLTFTFVWLNTTELLPGVAVDLWPQVVLFAVEMGLVGSAAAGVVWAVYLFFAHWARRHANEVFSSQSIADYKHFLRLRVRPDGVTIYPIGIEDVPKGKRSWVYQPGADGTPWFLPKGKPLANRARLVDGPIEVPSERVPPV
ncbi:hypothetical protein [Rubrivirga sp. IMCC45206]|uniref:hypothetical protein n=1 Tax=Rubrivirga sp. IMCC45206 TaxID=3391614 RepID=UPI0039900359